MRYNYRMKTIAVRQPWATMIVVGEKTIENRSRLTRYRGRVLIHASKAHDKEAMDEIRRLQDEAGEHYDWPVGAIIGCVNIVDCVTESENEWFDGPFGYVLEDAIMFDEPIPARGQLGIYDTPFIPTGVAAAILNKTPAAIRANLRQMGIGIKFGRDYMIDDETMRRLEDVPAPGRPASRI